MPDHFAILPYLRTKKRVWVRGFEFRSSKDLAGLADDVQDHLRTLCNLFYLSDGVRINEMICAHFDLPLDPRLRAVEYNLQLAHSLITYLYASPHPSGDVFMNSESASMFVFTPHLVLPASAFAADYGDRVTVLTDQLKVTGMVPGYWGLRDGRVQLWVDKSAKVYPELPHIALNFSQDLASDIEIFSSHPLNAPFSALFHEPLDDWPKDTLSRVFVSLRWYAASCRATNHQDESIATLAIAFESLLRLPEGGTTERFKQTVTTLLGPVERLDEWLEQFYDARSKIVHTGTSLSTFFHPGEGKLKPDRGKERAAPYRPLLEYGRRIYRSCLTALLSGATSVQNSGLASLFFTNHERLENVCRLLEETYPSPQHRLLAIRKLVYELKEMHVNDRTTKVKTLLAVGKRLAQAYNDCIPELPPQTATLLEKAIQGSGTEHEILTGYAELHRALQEKLGADWPKPEAVLTGIAQEFFQFASRPEFILAVWPQSKSPNSG